VSAPTKRKRRGGVKPYAYTHAELMSAPSLGAAMTKAEQGKFDETMEEVAHSIAALVEYRQRPSGEALLKTKADNWRPNYIHNRGSDDDAHGHALNALYHLAGWLTDDASTEREWKLPERLRKLADLLEARPLKPNAADGSVIKPSPADPEAFAVLSMAFKAVMLAGNGNWSWDQIRNHLAVMPRARREEWLSFLGVKLSDGTARKLIGKLHRVRLKGGRPKKTRR